MRRKTRKLGVQGTEDSVIAVFPQLPPEIQNVSRKLPTININILDDREDTLDMSRTFPGLWRREGDCWRLWGLKGDWWGPWRLEVGWWGTWALEAKGMRWRVWKWRGRR